MHITMKKTMLLAAFAALFAFSCQKPEQADSTPGGNDNTPSGTKTLSAPVLSADKTSVTLEEAQAASAALKLSWTSGLEDGDNTAISYTVYANTEGKDLFTNPEQFESGKSLEKTFTVEALNALGVKLGLQEQGKIVFGVYAVADKGTYESVLSNKVTVDVTLYKEALVAPAALYLVGAATPYGWNLSTALELPNDGNNVYKAAEVPLTVLPQSLNAGFKLYFSRGEEDSRFLGQDPASESFGDAIIVEEGMQDTQFLPAPAGYVNGLYDIEANLNTMKVKITRKGDIPEAPLPDILYMLGSCFEWEWRFEDVTTTLDKVSDKYYEAKSVKMSFGTDSNPLGFKVFLGVNQWSPYFAMADDATKDNVKIQKVEDSELPQFYPGKLGFEDGTYDISMDFSAMKATFTLLEAAPEYPEKLYMLGGCFGDNWAYSDAHALVSVAEGEYKGEDIVFTGLEDWNGFKIYSGTGWAGPWYGMDLENSTHDNIILVDGEQYVAATGAADTQIYLGRLGYTETGKYTITVNLKTMKLTATRTGDASVDGPDVLYLVGGCFTPQWEFSDNLVLAKGDGGIYVAQDVLMAFGDNDDVGFRIYTQKDNWGLCYTYIDGGYDTNNIQLDYYDAGGDPPQIFPGYYGFEDSVYDISFNINTMVLTLSLSIK
jgi:hypothetical protein